mgnify:CR=1 FL=1
MSALKRHSTPALFAAVLVSLLSACHLGGPETGGEVFSFPSLNETIAGADSATYPQGGPGTLKAAIGDLRDRADIVVVAFHWGIVWVPRIICDYQTIAARACIDAGADMILGHHSHVPKAIEMYKGKAIFYSLSNFCMTKPFPSPKWAEAPWVHGALRNYTDQDPEYPLLPYGRDAKRTLLAKAVFAKDGVKSVSFLPMMIDKQYRPEVLHAGDARFDDMCDYMEWASEGFDHTFTRHGDEVMVSSS